MTTLYLYDRPAQGTQVRANLTNLLDNWQRRKRANGGFHTGKFSIQNRGMLDLTDFYNTWIGMKIVERTFGIISYEGIIWQLDLIKNGVNYRRTLNPESWHNQIIVRYTDAAGEAQATAAASNTDSQGIYGVMEYHYILGTASDNGATAHRDRALVNHAWPESRMVGGVEVGGIKPNFSRDGLYITVAGFSATLNWRLDANSGTSGASSLINTQVGYSEFVTAGRIETNSLSTSYDNTTIPQRRGDLIDSIVKQGDSSGNLWKGGVYANQEFIYEQLPTTVDYVLQRGQLLSLANTPVELPLVPPGFYVRDTNAPRGVQPPGTSNIWDDPQVHYCDEVEFIWPDQLRLMFPGEKESVTVSYQEPPTNYRREFLTGLKKKRRALAELK
jgi:hypothetical protein